MRERTSGLPEALKRRGRLLWPIAALLFVVLFGYGSCSVYMRPGQFGVKQVIVGSAAAGRAEGHLRPRPALAHPGRRAHAPVPGGPAGAGDERRAGRAAPSSANLRSVPAIKIQTSEGYTVSRGRDGALPHRRPLQGDDADRPRPRLRGLGGDPARRAAAAPHASASSTPSSSTRATRARRPRSRPRSCSPTSCAARASASPTCWCASTATTSKYQQAIEQRKIQDQTVFKNQAEAIAAQARGGEEQDRRRGRGGGGGRARRAATPRCRSSSPRPSSTGAPRRPRASCRCGWPRAGHRPREQGAPRRRQREHGRPEDGRDAQGHRGDRAALATARAAPTRST